MNEKKSDLISEALEILDHAEIATIEGGYIWDPSCPSYPKDDDQLFAPFGPIGPIVLC